MHGLPLSGDNWVKVAHFAIHLAVRDAISQSVLDNLLWADVVNNAVSCGVVKVIY